MKSFRRLAGSLILGTTLGLLAGGCEQEEPSAREARARHSNTSATVYLDHAQPKLTTVKLWIGPEVLETEVAVTLTEVATGMMWRKELPENAGMLFIFPRPYRATFYMRNTLIPLSAAYIGSDGTILEIHDLVPQDETPVPAKSEEVQYVLEVSRGWFERHKIPVGTLLRTQVGSLQESFFRRK